MDGGPSYQHQQDEFQSFSDWDQGFDTSSQPPSIHLPSQSDADPTVDSSHRSTLLGSVDSARFWGADESDQQQSFSYSYPTGEFPSWTTQAQPSVNALQSQGTVQQVLSTVAESISASPAIVASLDTPTFSQLSTTAISPRVKPFVAKLWHLVSTPDEFRDCIVWDETGTQFIVSHASVRLIQVVLPRFFEHSSIHSFTRQLNVYGFSRLSQNELSAILDLDSTADFSAWRHPLFKREDPASLVTMTPKPSRARAQKKAEKDARLRQEDDERRASRSGTSCGQSSSWA